MSLTSSSLMESLRNQSDDDAWTRLCQVYAPLLRHWMARFFVRGSDQEDVLQSVLLVICQKLPEFEHNGRAGAFRTWLRSIVVFQCRTYLRNRALSLTSGEAEIEFRLNALTDSSSDLSRQWDQEHDRFIVRQMLAQIERDFTPDVWQAFCLLTVEGQTPQVVAGRLGKSIQAVYAGKARVLARLREEVRGWIEI